MFRHCGMCGCCIVGSGAKRRRERCFKSALQTAFSPCKASIPPPHPCPAAMLSRALDLFVSATYMRAEASPIAPASFAQASAPVAQLRSAALPDPSPASHPFARSAQSLLPIISCPLLLLLCPPHQLVTITAPSAAPGSGPSRRLRGGSRTAQRRHYGMCHAYSGMRQWLTQPGLRQGQVPAHACKPACAREAHLKLVCSSSRAAGEPGPPPRAAAYSCATAGLSAGSRAATSCGASGRRAAPELRYVEHLW
jgi:hypothetical protein